MGLPMARNLAAAGYPLRVYNRSQAKAAPLLADFPALVTSHDSVAEAVVAGGVVFTMLSDDRALAEVAPAVSRALGAGGVHVGCSTVSPEAVQACADLASAVGSVFVAAPVFGRPPAAAAAALNIVVSCAVPEALARVQPLLAVLGRRVEVCVCDAVGGPGAACGGVCL